MLLEVTAFVCGMAIMVIELLGARMISPFFGNSFYIWTGVIGVVLVSMTLGYWRGGILADRSKGLRSLSEKIFIAGVTTIILPLLVTFFGGLGFFFGMQWGAVITSVFSLSIPCYFLAMVSPYCIRLSPKDHENIGAVSGRLYSISTLGSIFGVFMSGFILLPYFKVRVTLYILGVALVLLSVGLYLKGSAHSKLDVAQVAVMSVSSLAFIILQLVYLPPFIPDLRGTNQTILRTDETKYNSIAVVETSIGSERYRLMSLGSLVQGGIEVSSNTSYYRYADYLEYMWAVNPDIHDVLIMGNGAAVLVGKIRAEHPEVMVDVVDIDPVVFEYASEYFGEREDSHTRFIVDDARMYLKGTNKKYDLIVMDIFGATHVIPFHIATVEMLDSVSSHLNPKGAYFLNLVSSIEGPRSILFKSELKTFGEVFPQNYVVQVKGKDAVDTVLLISGGQDYPGERLRSIDNLTGRLFESSHYDLSDGIILTDEYAPVEAML
ncbi:MAG: fused MFS/spermidine synthase [Candidatus Altiarchaeota archaeon]